MNSLFRLAPVAALALLVAAPVLAQQPQQPSGEPASQPSGPTPGQAGMTIASDSLIGTKVFDPSGKEMGEISKLMVDVRQGKIASAIIRQGGALGMGGREVAVPWESLTLQRGQNQDLVVTMQQQFLEPAPSASPPGRQPEERKRQ